MQFLEECMCVKMFECYAYVVILPSINAFIKFYSGNSWFSRDIIGNQ